MAAIDKEKERLINEKNKHQGDWITEDACKHYRNLAKGLAGNNSQDAGVRRKLRLEVQNKYGLLEIEAINILNGLYTNFYVEKYHRIKNCIVSGADKETSDSYKD